MLDERYGNLFEMYQDATGEDPHEVPMRIAPGAHFAMGGLWSDYDQMTSIPGLFVGGEAGWGYHGANRLGANSLLSACVDGWFTLPYSVPNYLADHLGTAPLDVQDAAVQETLREVRDRVQRLVNIKGKTPTDHFHARLGEILYEGCGVSRNEAKLTRAIEQIRELREEFYLDLFVPGTGETYNQELERAGRVEDYLYLAELMCVDALDRKESAGAHFREEYQTEEGEAQRNDNDWCFVSAWEEGANGEHIRHAEPLNFEIIKLQTRNYK